MPAADTAAQLGGGTARYSDTAHAASAIALDAFQGRRANFEAAAIVAESAAAAAQGAEADLAAARAEIAAFSRATYIQGITSPGIQALLDADGPAQLIERGVLLEEAGDHRSDVVQRTRTAQQRTSTADARARTALAEADALEQQAMDALTTAKHLETLARRQAAEFHAQQAVLLHELQQAEQTLLGLEGARAAAEQRAQPDADAAAADQRPQDEALTASRPATSTDAPAPAGSSAALAVDAAISRIGTPYAWAAAHSPVPAPDGAWTPA